MPAKFVIIGNVGHGKKRGKRLGFPTINIPIKDVISDGIYCSQTEVKGKIYNSLTFIGAPQMFGETEIQCETYLLDFDQNIYGEKVTVSLLKKIRENKRFVSEEALIEQMEKDKKQALEFFKKNTY